MKAISDELATILKDRTLWFDGDSTVSHDYVVNAITLGKSTKGLFVDTITDDIEQYNRFAKADEQLQVKYHVRENNVEWTIPKEYKVLDIEEVIAERFFWESKNSRLTHDEHNARLDRIRQELQLYENLGLIDVLRTLIYLINTLYENNVVWGVGRGSSVASYILYLIGVHDVDSVKYDLDITEFLRPE